MDIKKIKKNIIERGLIRDGNWVTNLHKKGRLYIGDNKCTDRDFESFRLLIGSITEIYDDNWDIEFAIGSTVRSVKKQKIKISIKSIIIHFPEITVSNRNDSHLIKHLFVQLPLYKEIGHFKIAGLYGNRLEITYKEFCSNYFHSHLSANLTNRSSYDSSHFYHFCTGSGEINIYLSDLNDGEKYTKEKVNRFLVQILTMVSHESISGGPYRRISEIRYRTSSSSALNINTEAYQISRLIFRNSTPNLLKFIDIKIEGDNIKVLNNDKIDAIIYNLIITNQPALRIRNAQTLSSYFDAISVLKTNPNQSKLGSIINIPIPIIMKDKPFIFKGEEKYLEITDIIDIEQTQNNNDYQYHPIIREELINRIENEYKKRLLRESTINRYKDKIDNAREGVKSNSVPVPANT